MDEVNAEAPPSADPFLDNFEAIATVDRIIKVRQQRNAVVPFEQIGHLRSVRQQQNINEKDAVIVQKTAQIDALESKMALLCRSFPKMAQIIGQRTKRLPNPSNKQQWTLETVTGLTVAAFQPKLTQGIGINMDRLHKLFSDEVVVQEVEGIAHRLWVLGDFRRAHPEKKVVIAHDHQSDSTLQQVTGHTHALLRESMKKTILVEVMVLCTKLCVSIWEGPDEDGVTHDQDQALQHKSPQHVSIPKFIDVGSQFEK